MDLKDINLASVVQIALDAGREILDVYHSDKFEVESKDDESPLTLADRKSHEVIARQLRSKYKDIPVLSEEGQDIPFSERKHWEEFWLVDPLDGTKEFIKQNGEFTVNIALVQGGEPVLGVIYGPDLDTLYVGQKGFGAYKVDQASARKLDTEDELVKEGHQLPFVGNKDVVQVVASRSHMSPETEAFINDLKAKHNRVETTSAGSSLKLCLVAEGSADYYPRYAPTMEWDTGAGHAIVLASGGSVYRADSGEPLEYNKENLKNPWFLAKR